MLKSIYISTVTMNTKIEASWYRIIWKNIVKTRDCLQMRILGVRQTPNRKFSCYLGISSASYSYLMYLRSGAPSTYYLPTLRYCLSVSRLLQSLASNRGVFLDGRSDDDGLVAYLHASQFVQRLLSSA